MKLKDLLEANNGSEEQTIELTSDDESVEVDVVYHFDVEPAEYEGSYMFYGGSVNLADVTVRPFTFAGKKYTKFTPDVLQYIDWPSKFKAANKALVDRAADESQKHPLTQKECDDLMDKYFDFDFKNSVAHKIDVPSKHYPMTR